MTPETFAEWLRRQGHRVVRTRSSYWFDSGPRVFQAFPYHWIIQPTEEELREFLCQENAIGLRYSAPMDAAVGACSYHMVREGGTYDLKDVDSSIRAKVRKGLEACVVGPIPMERYAREGWTIEQDTQDRQGRRSRHGRRHWDRMVEAVADLEGFETWGAEVDGRLAATLMFTRLDDCVDLLYQQSLREFLPLRVNNALLFAVTKELMSRPGIRLIHNGLHSLDAPASVDQFKLRLGYSARPVRQRVVFHPKIAPWIGSGVAGILEGLAAHFPESDYLQKTEGLTRFFCNGRLPLVRQPFPELLVARRFAICRELGVPMLPPTKVPALESQEVWIAPATVDDRSALVDLHLACLPAGGHFAMELGPGFLRSAYRWLISSPGTLVLVARLGKRLVGLTVLSQGPWERPLLRACKGQVLFGLLRRPQVLFRPGWARWFTSTLFQRKPKSASKVGHVAFTLITPDVRGHGIGQMLSEASIQACRDWGMDAVTTCVRRDDAKAQAFHERAGFQALPGPDTGGLAHLRLNLKAPIQDVTPA
ncbi:MAG: GNAT family N-acetyltransferase [Holophagaceae bacterium]|uniref:GNAT family N-acetyltransferase n=1 Tax=Candidatus Geothrix skivensis TaxID=2954439 RepID=A0A9D7SHL6_9BACT|nr:GNAT family N-acetyltransferase [Candidatus Geothrix skivensis]